jgi:chemotaxis protein CheX
LSELDRKDDGVERTFVTAIKESTRDLFATMFRSKVVLGSPSHTHELPGCDITGIIDFSGEAVGSVMLRMPRAVALTLVERFAGMPIEFGTDDFTDAVGELVNMIAGGAKSRLNAANVSISCPVVVTTPVTGENHAHGFVRASIPCESQWGSFIIQLAIKPAVESGSVAAADSSPAPSANAA